MMQGLLGYWFIPVNIVGTIALGAVLCIVFIRYTERRAEPEAATSSSTTAGRPENG